MKEVPKLIIESWRNEMINKRFNTAFKKRMKCNYDDTNWVGKEEGKPHPQFEKWLSIGKL